MRSTDHDTQTMLRSGEGGRVGRGRDVGALQFRQVVACLVCRKIYAAGGEGGTDTIRPGAMR
jgi:hypothetical protein